jgi:hypothetical protein
MTRNDRNNQDKILEIFDYFLLFIVIDCFGNYLVILSVPKQARSYGGGGQKGALHPRPDCCPPPTNVNNVMIFGS